VPIDGGEGGVSKVGETGVGIMAGPPTGGRLGPPLGSGVTPLGIPTPELKLLLLVGRVGELLGIGIC
jgi:hypothetical protein